ncbi:MAG: TaqI-like C-terminal specificity domain-containing protein [Verrucomicrobiota bacterium]
MCQKINELSVNDSSKLLQAHIGISNITSHLTFEAKGNYPCLKGIDIQRYGIKKRERYLEASVAEKYVSEHTHNKLIAQEIIAHIEHPKPHISIAAFWDEQGRLFNDTCVEIRILGEGLEPLFMLAYIQSKFVAWYAYNFIYNRAIRTMHFINYYVTQIPIPEKTLHRQDLQQPFIELSRNILDAKKANPNADVSALESEIDHLVYRLYGLTDEEIAIVEESVGSGADGSGKGLKTDHDKADDGAKSSASKKTGHGKQPKPHLPPSLPGWD